MSPHARSKLVEIYARDNYLKDAAIRARPQIVISEVVAPYYLFVESLAPSGLENSSNPVDGLLITMTKRMYEVASGILSLLVLGKLQQAEVLSRTLMESALSLFYIAKGSTGERLVQYFEAYIQQEGEQNRKWQRELEDAPASWKADHEARIKDKSEALKGYERFVEYFASAITAPYPSEKGWPNFFNVCSALGKAIDYRTVYMAMCSQSHSDANGSR